MGNGFVSPVIWDFDFQMDVSYIKGERIFASRYEVTESKSRKLKGAFLLIAIHVQYPAHS